jgi:GT2 family glycosyltransferase
MPALIDVVIPVYNGSLFVREAVSSIQNQTVRDIRIIIVDDGSNDETPAILDQMSASDPRIEVVRKTNGGIVDALNLGLSLCTADFIARHDADDLAYNYRFEAQLKCFSENTDCVAQSCVVRHIDETGRVMGSFGRVPPPEHADPAFAPAKEPYLIHPFLMMRREAVVAAGGYRYVFHSEDTDLYWRLREFGKLINMERVLGDYRMHAGSISGGSIENGRLMALSSQLSAISVLRRSAGEKDLDFPKSALPELKAASHSLQRLYDFGCKGLTDREAEYLKVAVSGKLLLFAGYRPYEIAMDDCLFLKSAALSHWKSVSKANRAVLTRLYSGAAARLAHKGEWRKVAALLWPSLTPAFLYRFSLRLIFPPELRKGLKQIVGPFVQHLQERRRPVASPG